MEPYDEQRFHLVLAHGIKDTPSVREDTVNFWRSRFPGARSVTNFPFFADDASWGYTGLLDRAQALLVAIQADRNQLERSKEYLPTIFLCHDLGGAIVKQALLLASETKLYSRIVSETALIILCDTPNGTETPSAWENEVVALISGADLGKRAPSSLLRELPRALEELHWAFAGIARHHPSMEIRSGEKANAEQNNTRSKLLSRASSSLAPAAHAVARWTLAQNTTMTSRNSLRFASEARIAALLEKTRHSASLSSASLDIASVALSAVSWSFRHGERLTEKVFDHIDWAVKEAVQPNSEEMRFFIHMLSTVDASNHQLRLLRPFPGSLDWILQHPSYREWQKLDSNAPNILYLHGSRGSGSAVVASHLVETLAKMDPEMIILSYSFNKRDLRTQPITTFFVSLIRQLLRSQPLLFRRVSTISNWIEDEDVLSYELLRSLSLSLLKGASPSPVTCVIYASQDCCSFSLNHIVTFLQEYRRLSSGVFKLAIFGEEPWHKAFQHATEICRDIDLATDVGSESVVGAFSRSEVDQLVTAQPQWVCVRDQLLKKLDNSPTYLRTFLSLKLLENARISTTRNAMLKLMNDLPSSLDSIYARALEKHSNDYLIPLAPLLQWVVQSVRPLTLNELAVTMALTHSEILSVDHLRSDMPLCIAKELQMASFPFFKINNSRVYPIHETLAQYLAQQWRSSGKNPDKTILDKCLDYLQVIFAELKDLGHPELNLDLELFERTEFALLSYAVTSWPHHYERANERPRMKDRIFGLLSDRHNANIWSRLYQKFAGISTERYSELDHVLKISSRFGLLDLVADSIESVKSEDFSGELLSQSLDLAAGHGHNETVDLLLDKGAQPGEAICLAAEGGFMGILQTLLNVKPDMIDVEDRFGRPPFVLAALYGKKDIVAYLLTKGADCNTVVGTDLTALHVASMSGQTEILASLIEKGADVNALAENGDSTLIMAAAGGFDDIVTLLLDNDVDINSRSVDGMTALLVAIAHGHASTCDVLLKSGADIQITSNKGLSAIHIASRHGYLDILQKIISKMGNFVDVEQEGPDSANVRTEGDSTATPIIFDISADKLSPLQLAASHGHLAIIVELLKYRRYNTEKTRAAALLLAAAGGFTPIVEELLKSAVATSVRDTNGNTALHLATQKQYPTIVSRLLTSESISRCVFDVNAVNDSGWSPLHLAARSGRLSVVQILLDHDAKVDGVTKNGQTTLHIATISGHLYIVRELLERLDEHRTVDNDLRLHEDENGDTAFTLAVQLGHIDIARALLHEEIPPLKLQGRKNALETAVKAHREDLVLFLLEKGWDVNASQERSGTTVLHSASANGDSSMIRLLLQRGANPDAEERDGERPLHHAVNSDAEAVRTLLELGANINACDEDGIRPLWRAAYIGNVDVVKEILRKDPVKQTLKWKPDLEARKKPTGWTPLHAAYDNPEITKLLLEAGADPKALTNDDNLPLFLAADHQDGADTLQYYLEANIDINTRREDGWTALHVATENGREHVVEFLLKNGANYNALTSNGESPIHLAAYQGIQVIVEQLMEKGVDIEVDCAQYGTPLMAAASRGYIDTVRYLIKKKVDVNATSQVYKCHTALQAAACFTDHTDQDSHATIEALLDAGADVNITGGAYGSALCAAVANGNLRGIMLLLNADADVNYSEGPRGTALELAMGQDSVEITDICFERRPDVNIVSNGRYGTALIAAIDKGNMRNIRSLLEHGANPNLHHPRRKETPAQAAVRKGRQNVLEALVEAGAKLTYIDEFGRGVLSHALYWRSMDLLSYLCNREDVDINQQDFVGLTPLMWAVPQGKSIVDQLIAQRPNLDIQDRRGWTALMIAIGRGYSSVVLKLIEDGTNLFITDIRGRDALYIAARGFSLETFDHILAAMVKNKASARRYQHSLQAAAAAGRADFAERLLSEIQTYSDRQADEDGWTAEFTAAMYKASSIVELIVHVMNAKYYAPDQVAAPKAPSEWHSADLGPGLIRQPNKRTITIDVASRNSLFRNSMARANHPMVPDKDGIFYFELTIDEAGGSAKPVGIGFCEELVPLGYMLGWRPQAWGYHGDDGNIFANGQTKGSPFGPKFGDGDTIGCGVNFKEEIAFYTLNGTIIGRAFTDIRGKLYPAVSVQTDLVDGAIKAKFLDGKDEFAFRGPFTDPKTLETSARAREEAEKARKAKEESDPETEYNTEAMSGNDDSSDES